MAKGTLATLRQRVRSELRAARSVRGYLRGAMRLNRQQITSLTALEAELTAASRPAHITTDIAADLRATLKLAERRA